eukprot:gb/GECG01010504.1/.p1 GENE.gb/GECG01010504.1/~~gb/GECG01010504.1/.p1  ORF type:complete len:310 (+),score=36.12 gb/GECG01010504.1/:1-930(+)
MAADSTSSAQQRPKGKEEKIKQTLQESLDRGDFYSALQMYRTYARRRENQKDIQGATRLYIDGAQLLTEKNQLEEARDLLQAMIDLWEKTPGASSVSVRKNHLRRLYKQFPDSSSKLAWLKRAIEWSNDANTSSIGTVTRKSTDPLLYRWYALTARNCEHWNEALAHFLYADAPQEFGSCIIDYSKLGYRGEKDLFVARTVLKVLTLGKLGYANQIFKACCERLEEEHDQDLIETPLMNFLKFILLVLERDAAELFELLMRRYGRSLQRDPQLLQLAQTVLRTFFPQNYRQSAGGPQNLMSMLGNSGRS